MTADRPTPAQIAKLIRADLKAAQADGALDEALRFSVRTETFAGGSSIDVTVKGYTGETHPAEYLDWQKSGTPGLPPTGWKTPEVDAMTAAVKKICTGRIEAARRRIHNSVCLEQTGGAVYA